MIPVQLVQVEAGLRVDHLRRGTTAAGWSAMAEKAILDSFHILQTLVRVLAEAANRGPPVLANMRHPVIDLRNAVHILSLTPADGPGREELLAQVEAAQLTVRQLHWLLLSGTFRPLFFDPYQRTVPATGACLMQKICLEN